MCKSSRIACIVGAMLAVIVALAAPSAFAGCGGKCGGGQVFSAPVFAAPQILAAPVYHAPQVFAAPVYQRQVFAAPVYAAPAAVVQKQFVVQRAQRTPLFRVRNTSRSVQRSVVRGNAAAVVY